MPSNFNNNLAKQNVGVSNFHLKISANSCFNIGLSNVNKINFTHKLKIEVQFQISYETLLLIVKIIFLLFWFPYKYVHTKHIILFQTKANFKIS